MIDLGIAESLKKTSTELNKLTNDINKNTKEWDKIELPLISNSSFDIEFLYRRVKFIEDNKLAEEEWQAYNGLNGYTENDKIFWIKGFLISKSTFPYSETDIENIKQFGKLSIDPKLTERVCEIEEDFIPVNHASGLERRSGTLTDFAIDMNYQPKLIDNKIKITKIL